MAPQRSPTDCTRELIVADWPIRSLIFKPKLHTLGRWAALHFKSLQCAIAFKGVGEVSRLPFAFSSALRAGKQALGLVQLVFLKKSYSGRHQNICCRAYQGNIIHSWCQLTFSSLVVDHYQTKQLSAILARQ